MTTLISGALMLLAPLTTLRLGSIASFFYASHDPHACRCLPTEPCWPRDRDWQALNASLSGHLIDTVPLASVCHSDSFSPFDASKCSQLKDHWYLPETHLDSASSIMAPYFANNSCSPWTSPDSGCVRGPLARYAVNISDAHEAQLTISFARKHNIRITIRNTGHDYLGKSSGTGAVSIWTHHLKGIDFLDYRSSIYNGKAVKIGAGVYNQEVNQAAQERGLVVVGGNCGTIAVAGGFTQGGGHSPLTSKHGLAADQVLEWEVVTGDGRHLIASTEKNPDLYWALSGGGGGTYGVVLSATFKAHHDILTSGSSLSFISDSKESYWAVVQTYLQQLPNIVDQGAVSYFYIMGNVFAANPTIAPGLDVEKVDAFLEPVQSKLKEEGIQFTYKSSSHAKYWDAWKELFAPNNVSNAQMGSRLLPRTLLIEDVQSVVKAYQNIASKGGIIVGIAADAANKLDTNNAVLPAWRDSLVNTVVGTPWDETDWNHNIENQRLMTDEILPELENLTPGGGAYLNEADAFQPDFKQTFYGINYDRLRAIKSRYDPDDMFYAITAVGSDEWVQGHDGRLCRASRLSESEADL